MLHTLPQNSESVILSSTFYLLIFYFLFSIFSSFWVVKFSARVHDQNFEIVHTLRTFTRSSHLPSILSAFSAIHALFVAREIPYMITVEVVFYYEDGGWKMELMLFLK